jgi:hypothetical protein
MAVRKTTRTVGRPRRRRGANMVEVQYLVVYDRCNFFQDLSQQHHDPITVTGILNSQGVLYSTGAWYVQEQYLVLLF